MLHPLEQVRDHQNPLEDTPALVPCQAPQLRRPRLAAKKVCWHRLSPKTWYAYLITLPHLGIPGSPYQKVFARAGSRKPRSDQHQECSTTDNHGYRLLGRPDFPATSQHSPPGARQNQPLVVPALITAPAHRRHRQLTVMFCDLDSSTALLSGD